MWGAWGCLISMVRILEGNMTKWGTSWGGGRGRREGGTVAIGASISQWTLTKTCRERKRTQGQHLEGRLPALAHTALWREEKGMKSVPQWHLLHCVLPNLPWMVQGDGPSVCFHVLSLVSLSRKMGSVGAAGVSSSPIAEMVPFKTVDSFQGLEARESC